MSVIEINLCSLSTSRLVLARYGGPQSTVDGCLGYIQKMDKPHQDNGNVLLKTFSLFKDKMTSGRRAYPKKRKALHSESCPKPISFLLSWFLSRRGPFACNYFLRGTEYATEFELLARHPSFGRSLGCGDWASFDSKSDS